MSGTSRHGLLPGETGEKDGGFKPKLVLAPTCHVRALGQPLTVEQNNRVVQYQPTRLTGFDDTSERPRAARKPKKVPFH